MVLQILVDSGGHLSNGFNIIDLSKLHITLSRERQLHSILQQASDALSRLSFALHRPEQHLASARFGVNVQPQQQHCLRGWAGLRARRRRASAARRLRRSSSWL